jgi:NAD(P)-dependent dehydrogenase (short-subunit alcohol dehydrogenase family)
MTMAGLARHVALVTGAGRTRGIGAAIANALAAEGCRVLVTDVAAEELQAVAEGLGDRGAAAVVDVTDERSVEDAVAAATARWGRLDIAVAAAGIGDVIEPLTELEAAAWDRVLSVNLRGTFLLFKHAASAMLAARAGGRLLAIGSIGARRGSPGLAAYNASKHGLLGLVRSAAAELGPHAVTVNAVCPNHVTTDMGAAQNARLSSEQGRSVEDYLDAMRGRIPLRRLAQTDDVARTCAFLASPAAGFITGAAIDVNGGELMS